MAPQCMSGQSLMFCPVDSKSLGTCGGPFSALPSVGQDQKGQDARILLNGKGERKASPTTGARLMKCISLAECLI